MLLVHNCGAGSTTKLRRLGLLATFRSTHLNIPYSTNGKKIELAVKQIISGKRPMPSGAVANPESFDEYTRFFEIENAAATAASGFPKL